jgi:hypothetical protein
LKPTQKICSGCGELQYIWKNVMEDGERMRYCKRCWSCHSGQKHKPTSKKTKPIAPRSPKRLKEEVEYINRANKFKKANPLCQIGIPGVCTHKTQDVHHMEGRENELLLKEESWKATCRLCHQWVTVNTQEAIDLGHSLPRTK